MSVTYQGIKGGVFTVSGEDTRPFAAGRASSLYSARDQLGAKVCVKVYYDAAVKDLYGGDIPAGQFTAAILTPFTRELDALVELRHPRIVHLLDYGQEPGTDQVFLVLEYCEGGDARQQLSFGRFFPMLAALSVVRQVASALDHAHALGIVHGDVKPENILFRDSGNWDSAVLSDFGSARRVPYSEVLSTGGRLGTTTYQSPEQLNDGDRVTPSSDIYSLAMVAYEALTGQLPLDPRQSVVQQINAKSNGALLSASVANPSLPKHVTEALDQALSPNPRERPQSALELCDALQGIRHLPVQQRTRFGLVGQLREPKVVAGILALAAALIKVFW